MRHPFRFRLHRLVLLLGFALAGLSKAETVCVETTTGTGPSAEALSAATELVRSAVTEVGPYELSEDPSTADFLLKPHLLKLGTAYVLKLSKLQKGKIVFSGELKAAHLEELDKVALRLTHSALFVKKPTTDVHVGEITDEEAKQGTQRRPARHPIYLGFGGATLGSLNSTGLGVSLGAALAWDLNYVMIRILADFALRGNALFLSAGVGVNYLLSTSDVAPYLGGDFGFGVAKADGGGALSGTSLGGFVGGVDAGILFFRTSVVNLDLGARVGWLLNASALGTPVVGSLRLGLYF